MVKYVKPSFEILAITSPVSRGDGGGEGDRAITTPYEFLEYAGRTCYKSEEKMDEGTAEKFVEMIARLGHLSVIEHVNVTVKFTCNRGFSHELVRHRLASYSQESTRYCNYGKEKFGKEITVIDQEKHFKGLDRGEVAYSKWKDAMASAEEQYIFLTGIKVPAQLARGVLPIDVKTEIVCTANLREWGHIFKMRASPRADPTMQRLMYPLLEEFKKLFPHVYDSLDAF